MGVFNIFNKQQRAQNAPAPYVNPAQKQANNEYLQQVQNAEAGNKAVQEADMQSAMQSQTQNLINQQNYDTQMQRYQNGNAPLAPTAQEEVKPVSNAPQWDVKNSAYLGLPQNQQQKQPQTWEEFRDSMYGSEAEKQKQSDRRAKVMAIGDALRHIGNLSTTIAGASPQKYSTAPASQERATYEQGRAKRDAMGYQMYQQKLNNDIKNAELQMKNQELGYKLAHTDAQTKQIWQKMNIEAEKYPYEMKKLVADALTAKANGDIKTYDAAMKQLELENKPLKLKLENEVLQTRANANKAATAASYASQALNAEKLKNIRTYGDEQPITIHAGADNEYTFRLGKNNIDALNDQLRGVVINNYSEEQLKAFKTQLGKSEDSALTKDDILMFAYSHLNDDEKIQEVFDNVAKSHKSNFSSNQNYRNNNSGGRGATGGTPANGYGTQK